MIKPIPESVLEHILVKDVMTMPVISVDSSITANDAAKRMEDVKISSIVVVENNNYIKGDNNKSNSFFPFTIKMV